MTYQKKSYPKVFDQQQNAIKVKLRWFKKHCDTLIGEESIDQLSLHDLQDLFDVYIDNDICNVWHVKTRQARHLQKITEHKISVRKFSYFVEQEVHANFSNGMSYAS